MSLSKHESSSSNTARICLVILGPCADLLRDILRKEISPKNLSYEVNTKLHTRKHTKKKYPLSMCQENIIFPGLNKSYNGDYSDFDISLLYILLRNFCNNIKPHAKNWGNEPDINDRGVAANIERIRLFRNDWLGHQANNSIPDQDFKRIWGDIFKVILELQNHLGTSTFYQEEAENIKTAFVDRRMEVKSMSTKIMNHFVRPLQHLVLNMLC